MVVVTTNEMPAKENVLKKGKRANETTRRTKMVMVTRNKKPAKKGAQKANETTRDQITDANNRTTCAQVTYCKEFPPSQRSNRPATGANAGLINAHVICYSYAIFQCIASCANLDNYADFLRSPPNEEHRHFELY